MQNTLTISTNIQLLFSSKGKLAGEGRIVVCQIKLVSTGETWNRPNPIFNSGFWFDSFNFDSRFHEILIDGKHKKPCNNESIGCASYQIMSQRRSNNPTSTKCKEGGVVDASPIDCPILRFPTTWERGEHYILSKTMPRPNSARATVQFYNKGAGGVRV